MRAGRYARLIFGRFPEIAVRLVATVGAHFSSTRAAVNRIVPPWLLLLACLASLALSSCDKGPTPPAHQTHAAVAVPAQPVDVFERSNLAIVGISYPPGLARYPGLAKLLVRHADSRRAVLGRTLARMPDPAAPLELTLHFVTMADSPHIFAVCAEEELYLGGPTSLPASRTFLWLPGAQRLVSPDEIIPDPATWARIHAYVRQRRLEESAALAAEPEPTRAMRHDFSPRMNSAGRIVGLRFRASDGTDVEVPASMLRPLVAPSYAAWFDDTPGGTALAPAS